MQNCLIRRGAVAGLIGGAILYLSDQVEAGFFGKPMPFQPKQIAARRFGLNDRAAGFVGLAMRGAYAPLWGIAFKWLARGSVTHKVATPTRFAALIYCTEILTMPRLNLVPPLRTWKPAEFICLGVHTLAFATSQVAFDPV